VYFDANVVLFPQSVAPTSPEVDLDYTTELAGSGVATEIYTAYGTSGDGVSQGGSGSGEEDGSGAGPTGNAAAALAASALSAPGAATGAGPLAAGPLGPAGPLPAGLPTPASPTRLPILLADPANETREALAHEGSEHNSVSRHFPPWAKGGKSKDRSQKAGYSSICVLSFGRQAERSDSQGTKSKLGTSRTTEFQISLKICRCIHSKGLCWNLK